MTCGKIAVQQILLLIFLPFFHNLAFVLPLFRLIDFVPVPVKNVLLYVFRYTSGAYYDIYIFIT